MRTATVEIMAIDANEKVRRTLTLTAPLRLLHAEKITPDQYRIAGAIHIDLIKTRGGLSGGRWSRLPEGGYISLPRGSASPQAPQERVPDASYRLGQAKAAVGADLAWAILEDMLLGDYGPSELDKRWKLPKAKGVATATIIMAIDRVHDAQVYEQTKWATPIWGLGE